jgi:hypothetical protein
MKEREVHYFTENGSFGSAKKLIRIVTTYWSDDDWSEIENASDSERWGVAVAIETKHNNKGKTK